MQRGTKLFKIISLHTRTFHRLRCLPSAQRSPCLPALSPPPVLSSALALLRAGDLVAVLTHTTRSAGQACKEAGVPKFIHVSAMAADELSPSEWLRRKAQGEAAVRALPATQRLRVPLRAPRSESCAGRVYGAAGATRPHAHRRRAPRFGPGGTQGVRGHGGTRRCAGWPAPRRRMYGRRGVTASRRNRRRVRLRTTRQEACAP